MMNFRFCRKDTFFNLWKTVPVLVMETIQFVCVVIFFNLKYENNELI